MNDREYAESITLLKAQLASAAEREARLVGDLQACQRQLEAAERERNSLREDAMRYRQAHFFDNPDKRADNA